MFKKLRKKYKYSLVLIREMVRSDFKEEYQDSAFGYFWTVLSPMFTFLILYVVFTVGLRVGQDIEHWPVALMAGTVLWHFFAEVTKSGLKAIVGHGDLLRKINFPRYTIIIAGTISSLISLLFSFVVLVAFALIDGVSLLPTLPLVVPLVIEIYLFSLGLAFFLSAVYVKFRDFENIWSILLNGMFYVSAIIYPISVIAAKGDAGILASKIILLNPASQAIQDVRHLAINSDIASLWTISGSVVNYLFPIAISIIVFIFGALYFRRKSPYFAEDF